MKIYLACSLTFVPKFLFQEYTKLIHKIAQALQESGHSVKYALVDSDPQLETRSEEDKARLCYIWDKGMVEDADLVIAECSFPSIGLGIELQIAEHNDTPIILIRSNQAAQAEPKEYDNPTGDHHSLQIGDGKISLMALGLPSVTTVIYDIDLEAQQNKLLSHVNTLRRK